MTISLKSIPTAASTCDFRSELKLSLLLLSLDREHSSHLISELVYTTGDGNHEVLWICRVSPTITVSLVLSRHAAQAAASASSCSKGRDPAR